MSEIIGNDPNGNPYDVELDPEKLVSGKRFLRGLRSGGRIALHGHVFGLPIFAGFAALTAPPEVREYLVQTIAAQSPEHLALGAIGLLGSDLAVNGAMATVSGVVDCFRPSSRFFKRYLEVDILRDIAPAYKALSKINYVESTKKSVQTLSRIGYGIIRPKLSESVVRNEEELIIGSTLVGCGIGVGSVVWSTVWSAADRASAWWWQSEVATPYLFQTIANNPIETIAVTTAIGLAGSTYAVLAGRRPNNAQMHE